MRKGLLVVGVTLGLLLLFLGIVACSQNLQPRVDHLEKENQTLKGQNKALKEIAGPPPASLDNFFPPQSPRPGVSH